MHAVIGIQRSRLTARMRFPAAVAALVATVAAEASGQAVRGRVLEEDTGIPVSGAMVVLTYSSGEQAARRLTDNLGSFLLVAPEADTYTIRADRIGYANVPSPPIALGPGDTLSYDIVVPVEPITLAGIVVGADRRCVLRAEAGLSVARLWEEARKALAAAAFTDETAAYRYQTMEYERDSDIDAPTIVDERRSLNEVIAPHTYVSRPVEELMAEGFVRESTDEHYYYAPDAQVLLSRQFLERYCMRAVAGEGETEGLVGLAFEPVEARDEVDIQGVLWLDAESSELRWLDFLYVNLTESRRTPAPGGKIVFARLPNGTWVVREWRIRRHLHAIRQSPFFRFPRPFVVGLHETGGVVLRVLTGEGDLVLDIETGTIEGSVFDSLQTHPLPGALVSAVGTQHADVTGLDGRFRLTGLTEGVYRIAYRHPVLDEIGYQPEPVELEAKRGEIVAVRLLTPSRRQWLRGLCADRETVDGTGAIAGIVMDGSSGNAVVGVPVFAVWSGWNVDSLQAERRTGSGNVDDRVTGAAAINGWSGQYEATTDQDGRFLFCSVPMGPLVVVGAQDASPWEIILEEAVQGVFVTLHVRE